MNQLPNQLPIDLDTLKEHIEHELVFTTFGTDDDVWNYTLACEDCQAVIADIDVPLDDRYNDQVVVLNDGETYTSLKGSKILTIPTDIDENDVDTYVKDNYKDGVDIQ
jgi:hypothetical protein